MPFWVLILLLIFAAASMLYMMQLIRKNPGAAPWSDEPGENTSVLAGHIENWPTQDAMVRILADGGIETTAGAHALRLKSMPDFVFRDFNGKASPSISADHDDLEALRQTSAQVSEALKAGNIRHRFEVYDGEGKLVCTYAH